MWFMGLVALLWILSIFIGFYLSLPKGKSLLHILKIKRGASAYRRAYDLHKVSGVFSGIVLLVVAFCGLTMNWNKETDAVVRHFSPRTPMPEPVTAASHGKPPRSVLPLPLPSVGHCGRIIGSWLSPGMLNG